MPPPPQHGRIVAVQLRQAQVSQQQNHLRPGLVPVVVGLSRLGRGHERCTIQPLIQYGTLEPMFGTAERHPSRSATTLPGRLRLDQMATATGLGHTLSLAEPGAQRGA